MNHRQQTGATSNSDINKARRTTKACARCRKRKIKCDFDFPTCGTCSQAGAECLGYDVVQGLETPRSTVAHLESHIAQLEIELERLKSERSNEARINATAAIEKSTARLIEATAEPWGARAAQSTNSVLSLASPAFLSQSQLPALRTPQDPLQDSFVHNPNHNATIASIPRQVMDIMLKNYCQIYSPQFPVLSESSLYESCERIYVGENFSYFDTFSIAITLAISATTLVRYNEERAMACAVDFWNIAADQLPRVGCDNTLQRLQSLLLLAHYGLLSPRTVNSCKCASTALRLSYQLGLHSELPHLERAKLNPKNVLERRQLYRTSYTMDAALHSVLCRPYMWPNINANYEFPESEPDKLPPGWSLKKLETEITTTIFLPSMTPYSANDASPMPYHEWYASTQERLASLNSETGNTGLVNSVNLQMFRLNRASPRMANPTSEMRIRSISAAIKLIAEYVHMEETGCLFYIWHAAHHLTELGASLLECSIAGLEEAAHGYERTFLDEFDIALLLRTIRTVPLLLSKIARRWPEISQQASSLEDIALPILQDLETYLSRDGTRTFDYSISKQRLFQVLVFSETVANDQNGVDRPMPQSTYLPWLSTSTIRKQQASLSSFDNTWTLPSKVGVNDAFWDSGGLDSDQIFAALLGARDAEILPT